MSAHVQDSNSTESLAVVIWEDHCKFKRLLKLIRRLLEADLYLLPDQVCLICKTAAELWERAIRKLGS